MKNKEAKTKNKSQKKDLITEHTSNEKSLEALRREVEILKNDIALKEQKKGLDYLEVNNLRLKLNQELKNIEDIKNSVSWKIGFGITRIPMFFKNLLKRKKPQIVSDNKQLVSIPNHVDVEKNYEGKDLFIYLDFNFSFDLGHYLNIYENIDSEIGRSPKSKMILIHDEWKYYSQKDSAQFVDYKSDQWNIKRNDLVDAFTNLIPSIIEANSVTIYCYKGDIELIDSLIELENLFEANRIDYSIINTLFIIPNDVQSLNNTFSSITESKINSIKIKLTGSKIILAYDLEQSIWNKYFDNIKYIPPPLINQHDTPEIAKKSIIKKVVFGLSIWHLEKTPPERQESIEQVRLFLTFLLDEYPNLQINLKITDSKCDFNKLKKGIFADKRVKLFGFMDKSQFVQFLNECDVYLLHYAPEYYKNKSSGHFIELLNYNIVPIGTKNTFVEKELDKLNIDNSYQFGDFEDFKTKVKYTFDNISLLKKRLITNTSKEYLIGKWSSNQFFESFDKFNHLVSDESGSKSMTKTVSVITPSLNQADFIEESILSIVNQTVKPHEYFILDPGSTDGSLEIIKRYEAKYEFIKLINEPDSGQSNAINKGFEISTGDVLVWLNSDDKYKDNRVFENVLATFNSSDTDVVYGNAIFIDEYGEHIKDGYINKKESKLLESFEHQVGIIQPSVFIKREVFEKVGGPPENMDFTIDYEYWVRIAVAGFKWKHIDKVLASHRWWAKMKTANMREESLVEHLDTVKKHFGYAHWLWSKRLAECALNGVDGIIKNDSNPKNINEINEYAKGILWKYNSDYKTLKKFSDNHNLTKGEKETIKFTYGSEKLVSHPAIPLTEKYKDFSKKWFEQDDSKLPLAWRNFIIDVEKKEYVGYQVADGFSWLYKKDWYSKEIEKGARLINNLKLNRTSETCIIVGNGPSLNEIDFNLFHGQDLMISNFAYYNKTLLDNAKYFTITNRLVAEQCNYELNKVGCSKIFPYWLSQYFPQLDDIIYLNANLKKEFSKKIEKWISWRSTVSFFNMQLAFALGYKKIILVGFDHSYIQDPSLVEGDVINQTKDDENHFDPRYFKGKKWQAADVDSMEEVYLLAKEVIEKNGCEIVNCTVGGKLEVFKRSKLENEIKIIEEKTKAIKKIEIPLTKSLKESKILQRDLKEISKMDHLDEAEIFYSFLLANSKNKLMINVGAHQGWGLKQFIDDNWEIYAFEPDFKNRQELIKKYGAYKQLKIDMRAISNKIDFDVPFYSSDVSTGISSLESFHDSHKESQKVNITRLSKYIFNNGIKDIDFLLVDAEGYDFFVVQSFPFFKIKPKMIICEFEDKKTLDLGYSYEDMAEFFLNEGYVVFVSEWYPIVEYGMKHKFDRIYVYDRIQNLNNKNSWGNLIAIKEDLISENILSKNIKTNTYE